MTIIRTILSGAVLTAATSVSLALPVSASVQAVATPVCVDTTNSRANNTEVRLWECLDHANQKFVIDAGQIKVKDTIGTAREVCLDTTNSRANNTKVRLWTCLDHANQKFVIDAGQIKVKDTIGTAREVCLDTTNSRANNT
ncbi:ricin-type beta-trefoil lectin domain protein, partial [Herbidospora sp. RD11066]